MSAESPRRMSRCAGQIVRPQPVNDKSVMESVVGFIQDVVPQAYSGSSKSEEKDTILWVRFECADINDLSSSAEGNIHNGNTPPLLLILGYSNGIQVWTVPANGEAQEVLSIRERSVKAFCILPTPESVFHSQDVFVQRRPLVAYAENSSSGQPNGTVTFVSLKTGDQVHSIKFKNAICNLLANKRVLVVSFLERIAVFDSCAFKDRFTITSCFPCPGLNPNPVALGTRWLAYADRKMVSVHQSRGGMAGEGVQSYAATVIHAAKTLTKGLTIFGETVASSLSGVKSHSMQAEKKTGVECSQPGVVTVVDIQNVSEGEVKIKQLIDKMHMNVHEDSAGEGIVAHFVAHPEPITALAFDPSGMLLLTADKAGHHFNIFRLLPHPMSSHQGAVHHLYTLYRGDTTAKVQDVAFSVDSRWVAVSTLRGTTHLFPITPYGGPISVRTHTSPRVVNKLSRFHKSAGLEDIPPIPTGRNSPSLSGSPGSTSGYQGIKYDARENVPYHNTVCGRMGNPRLPPYPQPTYVQALAQIRQPLTFTNIGNSLSKSPPTKGRGSFSNNSSESVRVVSVFALPRAWLVGSPSIARDKGGEPTDALYVMGCNGNLIEYVLDPHSAPNVQKVSDDTQVELDVQPRAQWNLISKLSVLPEVKPPLPSTNPLMIAQEMMTSVRADKERNAHTGASRSRFYRSPGNQNAGGESEIEDESWLSQVEIITHAGPHRRLWMGPQFTFQTFQQQANTTIVSSSSNALFSQTSETPAPAMMDIFTEEVNWHGIGMHPSHRSNPVAMPGSRQSIPLLIEAGSGSFEQSPGLLEVCGQWSDNAGSSAGSGGSGRPCEHLEEQLRENLADAMMESPVKERRGSSGEQRCSTSEFQGSMEELSSSSSHSGSMGQAFDARASPPHSMEHVLVFPADNGSPSSS
uniref:BCAS3 microtubule associated cell migration factor n=1 Tax=Strigamia maritima TaxID=126957 RepID=T1J6D8_STRMM